MIFSKFHQNVLKMQIKIFNKTIKVWKEKYKPGLVLLKNQTNYCPADVKEKV